MLNHRVHQHLKCVMEHAQLPSSKLQVWADPLYFGGLTLYSLCLLGSVRREGHRIDLCAMGKLLTKIVFKC